MLILEMNPKLFIATKIVSHNFIEQLQEKKLRVLLYLKIVNKLHLLNASRIRIQKTKSDEDL